MDDTAVLITADAHLAQQVQAAAAAAGRAVQQVAALTDRTHWRSCELVMIDHRQLANLRRAVDIGELPVRSGLVLIHDGNLDEQCWPDCLALGIAQLIELPAQADRLIAALGRQSVSSAGRCLAVLGSSGGLGASVLAAALALVSATSGANTVLADVDPVGAGLDITLGADTANGWRWQQIDARSGWLPAEPLRQALPTVRLSGAPVLLACPDRSGHEIDPGAVAVVMDSLLRADHTVIVDAGRFPHPGAQAALARADAAVLLVGAWVRSFAGAAQQWDRCRRTGMRAGVLVRGPSPGGLTANQIARELAAPLLSAMRPEPGLDRDLEYRRVPGRRPRSPLGRAARAIHSWLVQRP